MDIDNAVCGRQSFNNPISTEGPVRRPTAPNLFVTLIWKAKRAAWPCNFKHGTRPRGAHRWFPKSPYSRLYDDPPGELCQRFKIAWDVFDTFIALVATAMYLVISCAGMREFARQERKHGCRLCSEGFRNNLSRRLPHDVCRLGLQRGR